MNTTELDFIREELLRLRLGYRRLRLLLAVATGAALALTAIVVWNPASVAAQSTTDKDGLLHVRGLVVEDSGGHERLRLGAPLPDPLIHGVRQKRRGVISGLLISDPSGNERGEYVTSDSSGETYLTLDSEDEQEVMLLTNSKGGANFYLRDKSNLAQMSVFSGETYGTTQLSDGPKFSLSRVAWCCEVTGGFLLACRPLDDRDAWEDDRHCRLLT